MAEELVAEKKNKLNSSEVVQNVESIPKIFKLNIDCMDEIFEYLPLKDLHTLGETCKRMQNMTGEFFKRNYQAANKLLLAHGFYTQVDDVGIGMPKFYKFMQGIVLSDYVNDRSLSILQSNISEFKSIKNIYFKHNFNKLLFNTITSIEEILPTIEVVEMLYCEVDVNFYDHMLKYCPNLKKLLLEKIIFSDNSKLEQLQLTSWCTKKIPELKIFF